MKKSIRSDNLIKLHQEYRIAKNDFFDYAEQFDNQIGDEKLKYGRLAVSKGKTALELITKLNLLCPEKLIDRAYKFLHKIYQ